MNYQKSGSKFNDTSIEDKNGYTPNEMDIKLSELMAIIFTIMMAYTWTETWQMKKYGRIDVR